MPESDSRILDQFQRACPAAYRALAGRKFLLPNRCQASYSSQDVALHRRQLVLLVSTLSPKEDSIPLRSELINLVQSLRCEFPTTLFGPGLGRDALAHGFYDR